MKKLLTFSGAVLTALAAWASHAAVTKFEVVEQVPAFDGRAFAGVGTYQRIHAKVTVAVDPNDRRNAIIVDIDKAPRNSAGLVEATADVVILRPANPALGNGTLLVDIPNRGRKLAPQLFDDAKQPGANQAQSATDAGIGFLHRQGFTMAWIGWQGDIPSQPLQLAMQAPAVQGITGTVRNEFQFDHLSQPAKANLSALIADPASLKVSVRANWNDLRQTPDGLGVKATGPQSIEITRPGGFDAGALYEVTYLAKDPVLYGLGFAVVRDITAFLKDGQSPGNPLASAGKSSVARSIGFGVSQSGRFLRDFLWQGFNEDLQGQTVFNGLMPHIAGARRMATNLRFGQPSRNSRHPQDPAWQLDLFPFTYAVLTDPISGQTDGLLKRCLQTSTCPKVMQTDSEHEWWASRASLLVTDPIGNHIELPSNVRAYMMTGTPHYAEPGEKMRTETPMALPVNPMHSGAPMRALLLGLNAWIKDNQEPPTSRVPMRSSGTLVAADKALPWAIPGLPFGGLHSLAYLSDQNSLPPQVLGKYTVGAPLADADGMAIAGIRQIALAVPKASYTGWNPRAHGYGPGNLYPLQGAVLPFALTKEERLKKNDPRLSVEERYPNEAAYVNAVTAETKRQMAEGLLLPEDADRVIERAQAGRLSQLQ